MLAVGEEGRYEPPVKGLRGEEREVERDEGFPFPPLLFFEEAVGLEVTFGISLIALLFFSFSLFVSFLLPLFMSYQ